MPGNPAVACEFHITVDEPSLFTSTNILLENCDSKSVLGYEEVADDATGFAA